MFLGTGIYTPKEAAVLLHEGDKAVRRWAFGYYRNRQQERVWHPPLIRTDLPEIDGQKALTFVELVELLYIRAFQKVDVSWHAIKEAANVATRLYRSEHPFALRHVYVDPRSLYGAIEEVDGSESLIHLAGHGQHAFPELVKPYLEQIDFDINNVARRWWPMGRLNGVVIDPLHAFGAPTVAEAGIRTKILSDAYYAEAKVYGEDKAVDRVAWIYEVSPAQVETALRFKHWLQPAAA